MEDSDKPAEALGDPEITTGDVIFTVGGSNPRELLRLCADGRILVRGVETAKDKGLVDALREFIQADVCPATERGYGPHN